MGIRAVSRRFRARRAATLTETSPSTQAAASPSTQTPVRLLRGAILAGVALALLTPFVVTPETFYPYSVGKGVWSRALIEVVFALWAALALADPTARPPRSPLLVITGIGVAVAFLAGAAGADFQRSLWSSYERMQGVVDLLHWFAFFTVLVSVLRTPRAWRTLLALNLAAGTVLVLLVIARGLDLDPPFYGDLPERHSPRFAGPLGNPIFLGAYLAVNAIMALGFAAAAVLHPDATGRAADPAGRWRAGLAWASVAGLHLWGLVLAGSTGAFAGLLAGLAFAAAGFAVLAPGRRRRAAVLAGVLAAGVLTVLAGLLAVDPGGAAAQWIHHPAVQLLDKLDFDHPSVQGRLAAWRMSLAGFAERPLLGWGPENFDVVFGRFAAGYGAVMEAHDRPHGTVFEVAATAGAAGLAAWLALWAATLGAVWRAARGLAGPIQVLALFAGAALAAHFVQGLASFDTAASRLQHMLLLAFLAFLAVSHRPAAPRRPPAGAALLRRRAVRGTALGASLAVAVAGLAATVAIHGAARDLQTGIAKGSFLANFRHAIDGFEPLAGEPRRLLFANAAAHWEKLHRTRPGSAARFGALIAREAAAAVAAEPLNWRVQRELARLYDRVAAFDPAFAQQARDHLARAKALAPNRAILERALAAPSALEIRQLADGRRELRWKGVEAAGYHLVREDTGNGAWRALLYSYDASRTGFVPPPAAGPGPRRFAVKACAYPGRCSAWAEWPPVPASAPGIAPEHVRRRDPGMTDMPPVGAQ